MFCFFGIGRKVTMMKVVAIVLFFCFAECAAGSCLNYGHACWGAHGKRTMKLSDSRIPKSRWFLSKLIQGPIDFRYLRNLDMNIAAKHNSDPFIADEGDYLNGQDQWQISQDELSGDQLFDDNLLNSPESNRIRINKIGDNRSAN
ncbi:uncharacterized protein LOC130445280 [Diorhabda sublineata]|uniref:uncharacterized protein LOC130445280 n=1 Tax=Diorhabda sublineata TaxID=1163346 RepID=UPI0024E17AC5|nr:uncharacterized protein LOC130445280 [Diorhabda sublineata]